jgi:hypothetical protein
MQQFRPPVYLTDTVGPPSCFYRGHSSFTPAVGSTLPGWRLFQSTYAAAQLFQKQKKQNTDPPPQRERARERDGGDMDGRGPAARARVGGPLRPRPPGARQRLGVPRAADARRRGAGRARPGPGRPRDRHVRRQRPRPRLERGDGGPRAHPRRRPRRASRSGPVPERQGPRPRRVRLGEELPTPSEDGLYLPPRRPRPLCRGRQTRGPAPLRRHPPSDRAWFLGEGRRADRRRELVAALGGIVYYKVN